MGQHRHAVARSEVAGRLVERRPKVGRRLQQQRLCQLVGHLRAHDQAGVGGVAGELERLVRTEPEALGGEGVDDLLA